MPVDLLNDPGVKVGDSEEDIALMKVWRGKIFIGSRQSSNPSFAPERLGPRASVTYKDWSHSALNHKLAKQRQTKGRPRWFPAWYPSRTPSFCGIRASELCRALYAIANFSETKRFCNWSLTGQTAE